MIGSAVSDGVSRKDCKMGPHRPCGSIANGRRMVLAFNRSCMIVSPRVVCEAEVLVPTVLLLRMNLLLSLCCRCLSAMAVTICFTSAVRAIGGGSVL